MSEENKKDPRAEKLRRAKEQLRNASEAIDRLLAVRHFPTPIPARRASRCR